jgi:iron complex transport system ATP-binding protein
VLEARNIDYRIGSTTILNEASITVEPGEIVALCGPNGAGKSTLLKVLSHELKPSAGRVLLHDRELAEWDPEDLARSRAKLSQGSHLTFSFRVREVVEMGRFPHDTPQEDREIVEACMDRVGVLDMAERIYTSLSGGEKQRVHLARILAQLHSSNGEPKLLLLDEPTSALDLLHQEIALKLAHRLSREQHFGVIVVLHDLNLAAAWADRILMMKVGRIQYEGSPEEVLTEAHLRAIYGIDVLVLNHPNTGRPIITIDRG